MASFEQFFDPSPAFDGHALAPPQSEVNATPRVAYNYALWYGLRYRPCPTFQAASLCGIEGDEWTLVRALLKPSHHVLELGARFGTTSCVIAEATNNSGNVVSV